MKIKKLHDRKLIARFRVGSHLYGLQRPESDQDFIEVHLPSAYDMLGLKQVLEIDNSTKSDSESRRNTKEDIDDKSYSMTKFVDLLLKNNPNIFELLFVTEENLLYSTPEWKELADNRDKFVSKHVLATFTGYAIAQKRKMVTKKERYTSLVTGVDILEKTFPDSIKDPKACFTKADADMLNSVLKYYKGSKHNCESFHIGMPIKIAYEKLVIERDNYGWRVKTDTFETLKFDVKFGYHLLRIMGEGIQVLETGKISYPLSGKLREDIINIREGRVHYDDLTIMYNEYKTRIEEAAKNCTLREKADYNWANDWLVKVVYNHLQSK